MCEEAGCADFAHPVCACDYFQVELFSNCTHTDSAASDDPVAKMAVNDPGAVKAPHRAQNDHALSVCGVPGSTTAA